MSWTHLFLWSFGFAFIGMAILVNTTFPPYELLPSGAPGRGIQDLGMILLGVGVAGSLVTYTFVFPRRMLMLITVAILITSLMWLLMIYGF